MCKKTDILISIVKTRCNNCQFDHRLVSSHCFEAVVSLAFAASREKEQEVVEESRRGPLPSTAIKWKLSLVSLRSSAIFPLPLHTPPKGGGGAKWQSFV